jgi:hypothetical protein
MFILPLLALLASCGGQLDPTPDTLPQASGPPLAQQQAPARPAEGAGPRWESAVSGQGNALRLVDARGGELLNIACYGRPAQLIVYAPAFQAVTSEDRFTLGLGGQPVVLVANLKKGGPGVEATAPVPADLGDRLELTDTVTAVYGAQRSGPYPPPTTELARAFAQGCARLRP